MKIEKKLTKVVGLEKDDFDKFILNEELRLREASLIPLFIPGDEMALTSVILSSFRLIKEFRKMILTESNMIAGGQVYVFTDVFFPQFSESRVSGLLIIVKSGLIMDAAIFEIKNGKDRLDKKQIEQYQEIAKTYSIPKLITISNQVNSEPAQYHENIRPIKTVDLYHYSWSYLLTIAHFILLKNHNENEAEDQVELMREVVTYLENDKSGVCELSQTKKGWSDVIQEPGTIIKKGGLFSVILLKKDYTGIHEQIEQQIEYFLMSKGFHLNSGYSSEDNCILSDTVETLEKGSTGETEMINSRDLIADYTLRYTYTAHYDTLYWAIRSFSATIADNKNGRIILSSNFSGNRLMKSVIKEFTSKIDLIIE